MNSIAKHIYLIIAALIVIFAIYRCTERPEEVNYIKVKEKVVEKIDPIKPSVTNNYPTIIYRQISPDTSRRHQAEKESIITGVKVHGNEIDIQKIDSSGNITEEKHKIGEGSTAIIDNNGFEEKKRTRIGRLLKKSKKVVLRGLEIAGGIAIVYVVGKQL